ncbi:MAG TPA: ferritin-like domain-containing protein [Acidimicrobiales bacterium]
MPGAEIRRELRHAQAEHSAALTRLEAVIARVADGQAGAVALPRRRFLAAGSALLLSGAVLGACGKHGRGTATTTTTSPSTTTSTSTTFPTLRDPGHAVDVLMLRTASSLEHYAVGVYTEAAGLDVVTTGTVLDTMKYFADQHSEHASAFEGATGRAGGRPYTEPNKALSRLAAGQLAGLRSELDVLEFAYGVETLAAATYVASAGEFSDRDLNAVVTGIGAVEARHIAVLGMHLSGSLPVAGSRWPAYPADGLQPATGAVPAGLGL